MTARAARSTPHVHATGAKRICGGPANAVKVAEMRAAAARGRVRIFQTQAKQRAG